MNSPRKAKLPVTDRILQAEALEVRPPATPANSNTVMYIGQTRGPNPTKYFLSICFDDNEKRVD